MTDEERNGNGPPGDDGLPREVGFDPEVEEPLREVYVRVTFAAETAGVTTVTIQRHLQKGSLAGTRVGPIWLVEREALRWWQPDKPGPKSET